MQQKREMGVWETLFTHCYVKQRSIPERNHREQTLPVALTTLRTFTGMSRDHLAARLGMMPHTLKLFEERGGYFDQRLCLMCEKIAAGFDLQELAWFFELEGMRNSRKARRGHRSTQDKEPAE